MCEMLNQNLRWLFLGSIMLIPAKLLYAQPHFSGDSLQHIYLEMRFLYHVGVDIHKRYDMTDRAQVGQCKYEVSHNAARAKAMIGEANRIDYPDKEWLVNATWSAYACSRCHGDGKICEAIPGYLEKIRDVIKASLRKQ